MGRAGGGGGEVGKVGGRGGGGGGGGEVGGRWGGGGEVGGRWEVGGGKEGGGRGEGGIPRSAQSSQIDQNRIASRSAYSDLAIWRSGAIIARSPSTGQVTCP